MSGNINLSCPQADRKNYLKVGGSRDQMTDTLGLRSAGLTEPDGTGRRLNRPDVGEI